MTIQQEAAELLETQPEVVQEAIDRMRSEYEDLVAHGVTDADAGCAVWNEVVPNYPAMARAVLIKADCSGEEVIPAFDVSAVMEMIRRREPTDPHYDINALAGAVISVVQRKEAEDGDLGVVAAACGLDAGDIEVVIEHLRNMLAATPPAAAMILGLLSGIALARGDTPTGDTPLPEWVRNLG